MTTSQAIRVPEPFYSDQVAGITVYCGDCLELLRRQQLEVGEFDRLHVITDAPFSEATKAGARTNPNSGFHKLENSRLVPFAIEPEKLKRILELCADLQPRWVIGFMDWMHAARFAEKPPVGLRFIRCAIWVKPNAAPQFTGDRPAQGWEAIAILHGEAQLEWNGGGQRGVFNYAVERASDIGHPTPKPVPLMLELIELFTNPGDLILDPFMGSGTTLVAAKRLGRRAIGIELSPEYCRIAVERLDQTVRDRAQGQEVLAL